MCARKEASREERTAIFNFLPVFFSLFLHVLEHSAFSRSNSSDVSTSRVLETPKFELIENIANQKSILKIRKSFSNDFIA